MSLGTVEPSRRGTSWSPSPRPGKPWGRLKLWYRTGLLACLVSDRWHSKRSEENFQKDAFPQGEIFDLPAAVGSARQNSLDRILRPMSAASQDASKRLLILAS